MRALIEASRAPPAFTVAKVISDQAAAPGLLVARDLGVPAQALPARDGEDRAAYDRRLAAAITELSPSLVVLAGFMRILSADFIAAFEGRILNIHPSLLPKYPGLHTHRRALEARDAEHGATVHFVTAALDSGPPVIQARVSVSPNDDEASLAKRVQAQEHLIYPLAVHWFCGGRLRYRDGKAWLDGGVLERPVKYPVTR
jgi:phosphoribosylglycinamide formyltransferase-1